MACLLVILLELALRLLTGLFCKAKIHNYLTDKGGAKL